MWEVRGLHGRTLRLTNTPFLCPTVDPPLLCSALHRPSGLAVAVKIAPKARMSPAETRRLVDEVAVMARLRCVARKRRGGGGGGGARSVCFTSA